MRVAVVDLLWLIPLAPLGLAVVLFPLSRGLPRPFVATLALLAWLSSCIASALAFQRVLREGAWDDLSLTGSFVGATLVAHDPLGGVGLRADPLGVLLALGFALAAGVVLVGSVGAWGGGPRMTPRPLSSGQLLGLLALYGLTELAALSTSLLTLFTAVSLASVLSWALLTGADPKREQRDAAGSLFVLHRAGDIALFLALVLVVTSWGVSDGTLLAESSAKMDLWERIAGGPFRGFPARALFQATGALVLFGVASRVAVLPLPMLYRQATGLPAPALALVHGAGSFAMGVVVLLRSAPLWDRSELVLATALVLAAAAAAVAALAAATSRDVLRIDLHLLHAVAALGVVASLVGQASAAVLLTLLVVVLGPCLLGATGAVLEALQGRSDAFELGGLWRSLKVADRTRALATLALSSLPPFALWLALERTLFESLRGPVAPPVVAGLLVVCAALLTFAGFRALHLVYSGEAPRSATPANLVEAPLWRSLPALLVSLSVLILCAVFALPSAMAGPFVPGHQEPLQSYLEPVWLSLSHEALQGGALEEARRALPLSWRLGAMALLFVVGVLAYAFSAALYRKGPTRWHERLVKTRVPERTAALAESALGLERVFLSWLPSFTLRAARVLNAIVLGVVLEGIVTRAVALAGSAARVLIRVLHNGDVQRALFFAVLVAAALLFVWGRS